MKRIIKLIIVIFFTMPVLSFKDNGSYAKEISTFENVNKKESNKIKREISFNLQSPTYTDPNGGCSYYFTATITFIFSNEDNHVINVISSYPIMHATCPYTTGYARGVEPILTFNSSLITSVQFLATGDVKLDKVLTNNDFLEQIKNSINENIKKY